MSSETFHWSEEGVDKRKRATITFPQDTDVTREQAREAVRDLVENAEGDDDATGTADGSRRYSRGHRA